MREWLNKQKKKISNWYDKLDPNTKALLYPVVDLGKGLYDVFVPSSAEEAAEVYTPVYSDIKFGSNILDSGVADIQNGNYLNGFGKVLISPFAAMAALATPDGLDKLSKTEMLKQVEKRRYPYKSEYLTISTGKQGRPDRADFFTPEDRDIMETLVYGSPQTGGSPKVRTAQQDYLAQIDKQAAARQYARRDDQYLERKYHENTRYNSTARRRGEPTQKHVFPEVTSYTIDSTFETFNYKPALSFDKNWENYLAHLKTLQYSTENIRFLFDEFQKRFNRFIKDKNGGKLNYLEFFNY